MTENEIPAGYCQCGCGQKTKFPRQTDPKFGWVKGVPLRYIHGHQVRTRYGKADFTKPEVTVEDRGFETPCHIWNHATSAGYPVRRDRTYIHHEITGPIEKGFERHHLCGVRRCVNPDHLVVISKSDHVHAHLPALVAARWPRKEST